MIHGCASTAGIRKWLNSHESLACGPLGRTQLMVSRAGFGGYRITTGVGGHARALQHALASGINLIDTSANYADGGSEEPSRDAVDTRSGMQYRFNAARPYPASHSCNPFKRSSP